jgi:hypothetical protein
MLEHKQSKAIHLLLVATRVWLPLVIAIAGVVAVIVGGGRTGGLLGDSLASTGVVLIGVALMVWMLNWLFRLSLASNRDRERDEEARQYFDRTGRWPDEHGDA